MPLMSPLVCGWAPLRRTLAELRAIRCWRPASAWSLIALGLLVVLVGAAPAGAASLVYLDAASNMWIASPDGAIKRQLTIDATPTSLYLSPSIQDDGTVVVPNQDGFARVLNPDGTNYFPRKKSLLTVRGGFSLIQVRPGIQAVRTAP